MLGATAFIELLLLIKHSMLSTDTGSQAMLNSNVLHFKELYEETGNARMQPVILVALVISQGYLDKTVIQPDKGNFIKGIDKKLLEWLVESAMKCADKSQGMVAHMILNWNNSRNTMFYFNPNLEEVTVLKTSVRGHWIA